MEKPQNWQHEEVENPKHWLLTGSSEQTNGLIKMNCCLEPCVCTSVTKASSVTASFFWWHLSNVPWGYLTQDKVMEPSCPNFIFFMFFCRSYWQLQLTATKQNTSSGYVMGGAMDRRSVDGPLYWVTTPRLRHSGANTLTRHTAASHLWGGCLWLVQMAVW